jgi:hypothetical protein
MANCANIQMRERAVKRRGEATLPEGGAGEGAERCSGEDWGVAGREEDPRGGDEERGRRSHGRHGAREARGYGKGEQATERRLSVWCSEEGGGGDGGQLGGGGSRRGSVVQRSTKMFGELFRRG